MIALQIHLHLRSLLFVIDDSTLYLQYYVVFLFLIITLITSDSHSISIPRLFLSTPSSPFFSFGLDDNFLYELQMVQNSAKFVFSFELITLILHNLHWLPANTENNLRYSCIHLMVITILQLIIWQIRYTWPLPSTPSSHFLHPPHWILCLHYNHEDPNFQPCCFPTLEFISTKHLIHWLFLVKIWAAFLDVFKENNLEAEKCDWDGRNSLPSISFQLNKNQFQAVSNWMPLINWWLHLEWRIQ